MNLNNLDSLFPKKRPKFLYFILIISFFLNCTSTSIKKNFNEYAFYQKHYKYMVPEAYDLVSKYLKNNLDKAYVFSVIEYESADHWKTKYNWKKMRYVVSHAGAVGYMQLMKVHARKNPKLRYNTNYNIRVGVSHLSYCVWLAKKRGFKNSYKDGYRYYNRGQSLRLKRSTYNWTAANKIMKKYRRVIKDLNNERR